MHQQSCFYGKYLRVTNVIFLRINIALNKPANQNRRWKNDDAQNAVDGRLSIRTERGGECSKT